MGLPWVKMDTGLPSNPKILMLMEDGKHRAAFAWICSIAYSGLHGTGGFITRSALPFIHARPTDAKSLVDVGLWVECVGGWEINSYAEHQLSDEEMSARKKRAQHAAMARWHGNEKEG